jgi:hypothetical protein
MIEQNLSGQVLTEITEAGKKEINLIKNLKNPPLVELKPDDIYIRKVRLAGDRIDAYGGRFRSEDLPGLLKLTEGLPLLIGHRKDTLGVARFFNGGIENHDEAHYIVPRFYWLKKHSAAEDLKLSIDGGLVTQASISFSFRKPTCSICGEDIRTCAHQVGKTYPEAAEPCFYYYDDIVRVNEGSLVYKGAEPGTGMELSGSNPNFDPSDKIRIRFRGKDYLAIPADNLTTHSGKVE